MQLDQNMLNEVLKKSDAELWQMVVTIAALRGISLPKTPPPHEEFKKLRSALGGTNQSSIANGASISDALQIIEKYRQKTQ